MNRTIYAILAMVALAGLSAFLYQQHRLDSARLEALGKQVTALQKQANKDADTVKALYAEVDRLNNAAAAQAEAEKQATARQKAAAEGVKRDFKENAQALGASHLPNGVVNGLRSAARAAADAGAAATGANPVIFDDVLPGAAGAGGRDRGTADGDRTGGAQRAGDLQRPVKGNS